MINLEHDVQVTTRGKSVSWNSGSRRQRALPQPPLQ
jgi:hypothetical protein